MLKAVHDNLGAKPRQVLGDTGYSSEEVFRQLDGCGTELIVALGREGMQPTRFYAERNPYTAQMADKLRSDPAKAANRKRKWIAEPPKAGSRACWSSGGSACEACTGCKPSGSSSAWH